MEVGSSIEVEYQYPNILKDWTPRRNENYVDILSFIPPFKDIQIWEVIGELEKQLAFFTSSYGAILIQRRYLVEEPEK